MKININKNIGVVLGFVIIILGLYALGLFSDPKYDFETTHAEIQILCMNIHLAESENKDVEELYEQHEREQKLAEQYGIKTAFQPFGVKLPIEPVVQGGNDGDTE